MEIDQILSSAVLSPGQAGKLRGKLLFTCGYYAGLHGRCHLRPLPDGQYAIGGTKELTAPIVRALKAWKRILPSNANARDIFGATSPTPADAFIFSDGSHPDELHDDPPLAVVRLAALVRLAPFGGRASLFVPLSGVGAAGRAYAACLCC